MDGFSLITGHNLLLQSRGMFDGGTDVVPRMFPVDGYASVAHFSSEGSTVRTEDEQKNKGKDLFFCDLPELGGFDDFETNMRSTLANLNMCACLTVETQFFKFFLILTFFFFIFSSNLDTTFEVGSNYFDDTLWSSVYYSPDAGVVPISCFDITTNVSSFQNQSAAATLIESSVSVSDQVLQNYISLIRSISFFEGHMVQQISCLE
jgi:hypothetical protein